MDVATAAESLKDTVKRKNAPKPIKDTIDHVISYLVLLNLSSPSPQALQKLSSVMRKPFVSLYTTFPTASLRLSAAIFLKILKDKILLPQDSGKKEVKTSWEGVETALLSGVLDFLDMKSDGSSKEVVGKLFYPAICGPLFQPIAVQTSLGLRNAAYMLLSDTSSSHPGNQCRLRDSEVLGGERIGIALSTTKDFLAIESLLALFAWLLPPTNRTDSGRAARTEFIHQVFGSSQRFKCSTDVLRILGSVSSSDWEDTAVKIMDALAAADIMSPQPFALDEIHACGVVFPQPTPADRLYLDNHSFLANVIQDGNIYESLEILYNSVDRVKVASPENGKTHVVVYLTSPPVVAKLIMKTPPGQKPTVNFLLEDRDTDRFLKALRNRNVGSTSIPVDIPHNNSKRRQMVFLASGVKLPGDDCYTPIPPSASFEEKVKHVEDFYSTDTVPGDLVRSSVSRQMIANMQPPSPINADQTCADQTTTDAKDGQKHLWPSPVQIPSTPVTSTGVILSTPLRHSTIEEMRESIFGGSVEELSDCSDDEGGHESLHPEVHPPKERVILHEKVARKPRVTRSKDKRVVVSGDVGGVTPGSIKETKKKRKAAVIVDHDNTLQEGSRPVKKSGDASGHRSVKRKSIVSAGRSKLVAPNDYVTYDVPATEVDARECTTITTKAIDPQRGIPESSKSHFTAHKASKRGSVDTTRGNPDIEKITANRDKTSPQITRVSRVSQKRKVVEDATAASPKDVRSEPPLKKMRIQKPSEEAKSSLLPSVTLVRAAKLSRKGVRASSPILAPQEVEFDTIPLKVSGDRKKKAVVEPKDRIPPPPSRQTRATAMRSKDGKLEPLRPKPLPVEMELAELNHSDKSESGIEVPCITTGYLSRKHSEYPQNVEIASGEEGGTKPITCVSEKELSSPSVARADEEQDAPESKASKGVSSDLSPVTKLRHPSTDFADPIYLDDSIPGGEGIVEHMQGNNIAVTSDINATKPNTLQTVELKEYTEHQVPVEGNKLDQVLTLGSPLRPSTPQKEVVMIDLTQDESPVKKTEINLKNHSALARPYTDAQQVPDTESNVHDLIPTEISTIQEAHKCHNVTFASPLEQKLSTEPRLSEDSTTIVENSRRHDADAQSRGSHAAYMGPYPEILKYPVESQLLETPLLRDVISPVPDTPIVRKDPKLSPQSILKHSSSNARVDTVSFTDEGLLLSPLQPRPGRESFSSSVTMYKDEWNWQKQGFFSGHRDLAAQSPNSTRYDRLNSVNEGIDIGDIAGVLHEIHHAITSGISSRFEKVRHEVRVSRDRLLQDAVSDLREMRLKCYNHHNSMVELEEEYATYRRTLAHGWEDVIKTNQGFSSTLLKVIESHDRNLSSKTFPKSILPPKPGFLKIG